MAGPSGVVLVALLILVICFQGAVALRNKYAKTHREPEKDADVIASELELQLQSELEDAIKSSATFLPLLKEYSNEQPDSYNHADPTTRIDLTDEAKDAASWNAFKLGGRAKLQRFARALGPKLVPEPENNHDSGLPEHQTSPVHLQLPLPTSIGQSGGESAVLVNAKQYDRILKRRLARQMIEEYFRSRPQGKYSDPRREVVNGCMRRPRMPGGRFLTLEELSQMESGLHVNPERNTLIPAS